MKTAVWNRFTGGCTPAIESIYLKMTLQILEYRAFHGVFFGEMNDALCNTMPQLMNALFYNQPLSYVFLV